MQEPTTSKRGERLAPGWSISAPRAISSPVSRTKRAVLASALAAGILSLPILGLAAEKKKAPAQPVVSQTASTTAPAGASSEVIPGAPVTPQALKIAAQAKPGQIIPIPESQDKAPVVGLAKVLSGNTTSGKPASGEQTASAAGRSDTYIVRETRTIKIDPRSVIQMSHDVSPGLTQLAHSGTPGLLQRTYDVTYKAGKPIHFKLVSEKVVKAVVNRVLLAGIRTREARALPSRYGMYTRVRELDMVATGYSPYEGSGSGRCATGMRAGYGVVAVDPRVIPLGSRLYIEGYGYAIAGDTGGAIRRNRIDLGMNSYRQANRVGRRVVHVYVLSEMR